jgi:hypothetical protein
VKNHQAIKSPTTSSGGLARQAGKSVLADLTLGIRQKRSQFSPRFRQRSLLNTGRSEVRATFLTIDSMNDLACFGVFKVFAVRK